MPSSLPNTLQVRHYVRKVKRALRPKEGKSNKQEFHGERGTGACDNCVTKMLEGGTYELGLLPFATEVSKDYTQNIHDVKRSNRCCGR